MVSQRWLRHSRGRHISTSILVLMVLVQTPLVVQRADALQIVAVPAPVLLAPSRRRLRVDRRSRLCNNSNDNDEAEQSILNHLENDDSEEAVDPLDSLDEWLDKPFFDPLSYSDEDSSWQARLGRFVQSDYDRFELLYAGAFFFIMIIVSQELFRMQLYGGNYRPFTSGLSDFDGWFE